MHILSREVTGGFAQSSLLLMAIMNLHPPYKRWNCVVVVNLFTWNQIGTRLQLSNQTGSTSRSSVSIYPLFHNTDTVRLSTITCNSKARFLSVYICVYRSPSSPAFSIASFMRSSILFRLVWLIVKHFCIWIASWRISLSFFCPETTIKGVDYLPETAEGELN